MRTDAPTLLVQDNDDSEDAPHPPPSPKDSLHRPDSIPPSPHLPVFDTSLALAPSPSNGSAAEDDPGSSRSSLNKKASRKLAKILPDVLRPPSLAPPHSEDETPTPTGENGLRKSATRGSLSSVVSGGSKKGRRSRAASISSFGGLEDVGATPPPLPPRGAKQQQAQAQSLQGSTSQNSLASTLSLTSTASSTEHGPPTHPLSALPSAPSIYPSSPSYPSLTPTLPPPPTSPLTYTQPLSRSSSLTSQTTKSHAPSTSGSWRRPTSTSQSPQPPTIQPAHPPSQQGSTSSRRKSNAGPMGIAALASSSLALGAPAGMATPPHPPPPSQGTLSPTASLRPASGRSARTRASTTASSSRPPSTRGPLPSTSANSSDGSEFTDSDEDDALLSPGGMSLEGLGEDDEDIPSITGFAVASMKRQGDFHELFPEVGGDDYLIEDYGCALQREILIQGRLYISENHICFHANIFGWVTNLVIPFTEINALEKKMTAFVIPNAIQVTLTNGTKHAFASFLSRDTTFDVITNIWRLARPQESAGTSLREGSLMEDGEGSPLSPDWGRGEGGMNGVDGEELGMLPPAGGDGQMMLTPTPASLRAMQPSTTSSSLAATAGSPPHTPASYHPQHPSQLKRVHTASGMQSVKPHRVTYCSCGRKGEHASEVCMDAVFPGTVESIYNLMFASGFVKEFMTAEQGLRDLQISDWTPESVGSHLLSRQMSYIKPLNASVGPRQTKCELKDETVYVDFDEFVTMMTTTRTPDVPSGGAFAVKTRTCLTWAGGVSTRVVVTTMVDWTGRSFIKSIIDRNVMDGQRTYHKDLERAMRRYITDHRGEFVPEGVPLSSRALTPSEPSAAPGEPVPSSPSAATKEKSGKDDRPPSRAKLDGMRGLQWVLDTATGAGNVGRQSFWAAIDLIGDVIEDWNWTTVLALVVFVLLVSNVWTLVSLQQARGREELTRRRKDEYGRLGGMGVKPLLEGGPGEPAAVVVVTEEDNGKVAAASVATEAVKVFLEEMAVATRQQTGGGPGGLPPPAASSQEEVELLGKALDEIELRVRAVREALSVCFVREAELGGEDDAGVGVGLEGLVLEELD